MKRSNASEVVYDPSGNPNTSATRVQDAIDDVSGAVPDAAAVKTLYESNADTNAFTDAEQTKLSGIESGATTDQTDAEIKTAYENNTDTNAFTDAEKTKLAGLSAASTGTSDPATAPSNEGDIFINTDTDNASIATGTASADDWQSLSPKSVCFFDGATGDGIDIAVTSDGATITCSVSKQGGAGNVLVFMDGTQQLIDLSTAATVSLSAGTDTVPAQNYVYFNSSKVLTASTTSFPASGQFIPVGTILVQSAATVQTTAALKIHKYEDSLDGGTTAGHLNDVNFWIRQQPATWLSGGALTPTITTNGGSADNFDIAVASGNVLQLHTQDYPAFDTSTGSVVYVVNDDTTPYTTVTDLNSLLTDSEGNSMSGRRFNLVIWGVVSQDDAECHLMVNLPSDSYNSNNNAIIDADNTANYSIPSIFRGVGFLIARLTVRHQTQSSGTWSILQNEDLRGLFPTTTGGGAGGAAPTEFPDSTFRVVDDGDSSKQAAFECSGITTATTRALTVPDEDGTIMTTTYSGGNVGIGESSPDTLLHLTDSDSTTFADALDGTTLNEGGVLVTIENTSNTNGAFTGVEFQNKNASGNTQSAYIAALSSSTANSCSMSLGVRTGGNLSEAIRIDQTADVGIGTDTPAAKLDVDGVIKSKSYTVATVPTAVVGGIIYVSDETGGATLAFGDGTNWRRPSDLAIVS